MPIPGQALGNLSPEQVQAVRLAFGAALAKAAASLSEMVRSGVQVIDGRIEVVSLAAAAALAGRPDAPTVAIYLGITGSFSAHVVLLLAPDDAERLVELLLGPADGAPHGPGLAESALGEVGNVMGSSFAIVLGDLIGSPLWSTPPTVQTDMARALVDGLIASAGGEQDSILVVVTSLAQVEVQPRFSVRGTFLVLPEPGGLVALVRAVGWS